MNFQAAVKGIAPAGGIRPASHITASFVSATKAKPAAPYFGGACCTLRHLAAVIEGTTNRTVPAAHDAYGCVSDLSRSSTLFGQRSNMDERFGLEASGRRHIELGRSPYGDRKFGNPCVEKVSAHRSRQSSAPVGHRQGMLTITGSNVHLGAEMPVALSYF